MTKNIFLLSCDLKPEDRFTGAFHYLLDVCPNLGQMVTDHLLKEANRPPATFIKAIDHPYSDAKNYPDMLLECEEFDIICEHKLSSMLGERQLERYLNLKWKKPFFVALITNQWVNIDSRLLQNSRYLWPRGAERPYYLWKDLYPLISANSSRLAQDFAGYMRTLNMKPWHSTTWNGLFNEPETKVEFNNTQWEKVRCHFKGLAKQQRTDNKREGIGFQIMWPLPWLRLFYLAVRAELNEPEERADGPYLLARIFINESHPVPEKSRQQPATLAFSGGTIFTRPCDYLLKDGNHCIFEYHAPFDDILSNDSQSLSSHILDFATTVFEHAQTFQPAA